MTSVENSNTKLQATIQDVIFVLSEHQIKFDAPNYFADFYFGHWTDSPPEERHIQLPWRDSNLFSIIITYLNGYSVFPLDKDVIPERLSVRQTLLNLRVDARFYRLGGLVDACDEQLERMGIDEVLKKRYIVIAARYTFESSKNMQYAYEDNLAEAIFQETLKYAWKTYITEDNLAQPPFDKMFTLESEKDFEGLRSAGAAERFMARSLDEYDPRRYRLVGWTTKDTCHSLEMEGLVVCEDWGTD